MLASGDIGALGRQGIFHTLNPLNAPKTARAGAAMIRAIRDQGAQAVEAMVFNSPMQPLRERAGLGVKRFEGQRLRDRESLAMNSLVEHVALGYENRGEAPPLVLRGLMSYMRASEENMVAALNVLRAELFDDFVLGNAKRGVALSDEEMRAWANYINVTTGMGPTRVIGGDVINRMFFSLPLTTARLVTPYTIARTALVNPRFARRVGADLAGFVGTAGAVLFLASLIPGVDIEDDPADSDFLKIQFGNNRVEFLGGFSSTIRAFVQTAFLSPDVKAFLAGRAPGFPGGFNAAQAFAFSKLPVTRHAFNEPKFGRDPDFYGLWGNMLHWKFAPGITSAVTLATGKGPFGEDVTKGEAALKAVTPIFIDGTIESLKEGGILNGLAALAINQIGVGYSTYDQPFKHLTAERVIEHADYRPTMQYDKAWTPREREEAKILFESKMLSAMQSEELTLLRMNQVSAASTLKGIASGARAEVKAEMRAQ
jgi:hypothetical protein